MDNFIGNLRVKEFGKSVYICQSYDQKSSALFFWDTVYSYGHDAAISRERWKRLIWGHLIRCTTSGLQSIPSMVRRRRLSLFGHVARMPDNYLPAKAVLHVACDVRDGVPPFPNWCRPWGRPPITWLHQICSDCGLSAGDALNCVQNRPCVDDDDDLIPQPPQQRSRGVVSFPILYLIRQFVRCFRRLCKKCSR